MVFDFDERYICPGLALTSLGASVYVMGYMFCFKKDKEKEYPLSPSFKEVNNDIFDTTTYLFVILNVVLLIVFKNADYNEFNEGNSYLSFFFLVALFFSITLLYKLRIVSIVKNRNILHKTRCELGLITLLLLCMFYYLMKIGDRGPIIQYVLIVFALYNVCIKQFKFSTLVLIGVLAVLFMVFIRDNRIDSQHKESMEKREKNYGTQLPAILDATTDLMTNARCVYFGMELVDRDGYMYGKSFIKPILSPIPFLPSVVMSLFWNASPTDFSTGTILTLETQDYIGRETAGLGTNNVIDLYMNMGVAGVCFFMFGLGYFVSYVETRRFLNAYFLLFYTIFISYAIYMPRSTIFDPVRSVLWGALFLYIRNLFPNRFVMNLK